MPKIVRISSMVIGVPCAVMIDYAVKYYPVHSLSTSDKKLPYIKIKSKKFFEKDLPMGEEIII